MFAFDAFEEVPCWEEKDRFNCVVVPEYKLAEWEGYKADADKFKKLYLETLQFARVETRDRNRKEGELVGLKAEFAPLRKERDQLLVRVSELEADWLEWESVALGFTVGVTAVVVILILK